MDVVRVWDGVGGFIEVGRVPPSCTSWCLSLAWVLTIMAQICRAAL